MRRGGSFKGAWTTWNGKIKVSQPRRMLLTKAAKQPQIKGATRTQWLGTRDILSSQATLDIDSTEAQIPLYGSTKTTITGTQRHVAHGNMNNYHKKFLVSIGLDSPT